MKLDRSRAILILLSAVPLLLGSYVAMIVLDTAIIGRFIGAAHNYSPMQVVAEAVVSVLLGGTVVFLLFWVLQRRGRGARKLVVAFVASPILFFVSMFLSQSLLLILFKDATGAFQGLMLVLSLAVSMLSIVLIIIDAIPPRLRNLYVAFYSSIFGIFMGITMITSTMFVLIMAIILEDFFLTKFSPAAQSATISRRIDSDPFDYARIQSERVMVGAGDFITFALISAHSLVYFPSYVWAASVLLCLLGIVINVTIIAKEGEILPAIPLPALLALFPWVIHLVALTFIAG
jgi:hypothetical protein